MSVLVFTRSACSLAARIMSFVRDGGALAGALYGQLEFFVRTSLRCQGPRGEPRSFASRTSMVIEMGSPCAKHPSAKFADLEDSISTS